MPKEESPRTFDRFHQVSVTPRGLILFLLLLAGLYLLFDQTDLWYVIFPD